QAEYGGALEGREIVLVPQEVGEVAQPGELGADAEGILQLEGEPEGLRCRPEEKYDRDRDLRHEQRVRQPRRAEYDALFHSRVIRGRAPLSLVSSCSPPGISAESRCRGASLLPSPSSRPSCRRIPLPSPPRSPRD